MRIYLSKTGDNRWFRRTDDFKTGKKNEKNDELSLFPTIYEKDVNIYKIVQALKTKYL